jgi:NADH dehydrogenase FAD-containing subunit
LSVSCAFFVRRFIGGGFAELILQRTSKRKGINVTLVDKTIIISFLLIYQVATVLNRPVSVIHRKFFREKSTIPSWKFIKSKSFRK